MARYDLARAEARLALLEEQGVLASKISERDGLNSGELFPAMDDTRRQATLTELDAGIAAAARAVDVLALVVGDAEAVPDENGWLPAERRDLALTIFAAGRVTKVRELRGRVSSLQEELTTAKGCPERPRIRESLRKDSARLAFLEAIPPIQALRMCSECVTPAAWHSLTVTFSAAGSIGGPCPAWPRWRQHIEQVRRELLARSARTAEPPAAKPQPIAVIDSGQPIEKVIAQLTAVQADHPGAQVHRGSHNRWEIWPPETTPS